jgi:hypothetical protein
MGSIPPQRRHAALYIGQQALGHLEQQRRGQAFEPVLVHLLQVMLAQVHCGVIRWSGRHYRAGSTAVEMRGSEWLPLWKG